MHLATKFKPDEDPPFQTALDAGLRCAELWTGPAILDDWENVVARCRRFDLRYALHFPTRRDLTETHLRNFAALYQALGCRSATIHEPEYRAYGDAMRAIDPGVCLAVENSFLDPVDFDRWAEASPALTFDAEHVWFLTLPDAAMGEVLAFVEKFLAQHAGKIRHVHMPGYTPGRPDHQPMYTAKEYVTAVLSLLRNAGYDAMVVSETDVAFQTLDEIRKDRELFEAWQKSKH